MARVAGGEEFRAAFASVAGMDVESFAERFAGSVRSRYGWLIMLTRWPALFALMALFFLIGAGIRLARRRRRLQEMPE